MSTSSEEDRYVTGLEGYCECGTYARKNTHFDTIDNKLLCSQCFIKERPKHKAKCFICPKKPSKGYDLLGKRLCAACYNKYKRPKNLVLFEEMINESDEE